MTKSQINRTEIPGLLNSVLQDAEKSNIDIQIPTQLADSLDKVAVSSEDAKAALAVVITSLTVKIIAPTQDIRAHQAQLPGGYSGRSIDANFVTPFLKKHHFPAMAESGWLTRSFENSAPYDRNYPGILKSSELKSAFLNIIEYVNTSQELAKPALIFLFRKLIQLRNSRTIQLSRPVGIPIERIIIYLENHFDPNSYNVTGASRLPTIALYSAYQCLLSEVKRFEGKRLLSLEAHTSADSRSGRIGDIQIDDISGPFEGVEVKHGIPITAQLVQDSFEKFKIYQTKRYYILSTADIPNNEKSEISEKIASIKSNHGCQVIVNGIIPTIKYYLRLFEDPSLFIQKYVDNLEADETLKYQHKERWNIITDPTFQRQ